MNATAAKSITITLRKFANRRLARDWKTVSAMLHIYCRDQHGGNLCHECQGLMSYVNVRLGTFRQLPFRRGEADVRKMSGALLPTGSPRTDQNRDAPCRPENALEASHAKSLASV